MSGRCLSSTLSLSFYRSFSYKMQNFAILTRLKDIQLAIDWRLALDYSMTVCHYIIKDNINFVNWHLTLAGREYS